LFASTQAPQFTAKGKPREGAEGVEEDQTDYIKTDLVLASTQAPVTLT
jgi:hypothetical protein